MSRLRFAILVLGPLLIVAASLAISSWARRGDEDLALEGNHVFHAPGGDRTNRADDAGADPETAVAVAEGAAAGDHPQGTAPDPAAGGGLADACQAAADDLAAQLDDTCSIVARPPFVLAGDLSQEDLAAWHARTIRPAAQAMAAAYFRTPPDRPITVLLFASEESYRHYAYALFGDEDVSVYGYYKPGRRTLVMNIATGGGTLVHELTHALVDFDYPAVPDWFNEGLASLHEQCRFREDGRGIDGLVNWRLPALKQAIEQGRLRSLARLIGDDDFRGAEVGINYAQARYFCMFLQERGLLEEYYARLRANQADDPLGLRTAAELFPDRTWPQIDAEFQAWVLTLDADLP